MPQDYRVMGIWKETQQEFLICMGTSESEIRGFLAEALSGYTNKDLRMVRQVWIERWDHHRNPWSRPWKFVRLLFMSELLISRKLRSKRRKAEVKSWKS